MATRTTIAGAPARRISWKHVTLGALLVTAAVNARFLVHYAAPYFAWDPKYFDYFWPHRWRLIMHICGGIVALICGTLQMWTGLRRRAMRFHRWTGRVYLGGVAVGITGAFLMTVYTTPHSFGVALMGLATAWGLTTAIAYAAILKGQVQMHREWMTRSYLVTFAFVTFRVLVDNLPGLTARFGSSPDDTLTNTTWICWVVPLAVYEVILQSKRLRAIRARVAGD